MDCVGYQPPYPFTNEYGNSYVTGYCEGCGRDKTWPEEYAPDLSPPMFLGADKKGGCDCNKKKELTEYADSCTKCGGDIYLTPGAAMYRKRAGGSYVPRREYCNSCLNEVVFSGKCRNTGCKSVGGLGVVEATFGEQLSYAENNLTFPPNNCPVCRKAIKAFKQRQEVRPTCRLCKRSFRVTYGVMIMTLKNEEHCETPKECLRCRGLSPDDRRRLEQENALDKIGLQRRNEAAKVLSGNKEELRREKERRATAIEEKKREFRKRLHEVDRLSRQDMRAVLDEAKKEGTLLSVLSNPKDAGYHKLQDVLAHVSGGKGKMTEKEYHALPQAFRSVIELYPKAMGLFDPAPKYRGKGSSALHQHYEMLATAAIINAPVKTRSGKELFINSAKDKVDFGQKITREASLFNEKTGFIENIFGVRSRTIEADTLVYKPDGREVAIDAKYTKNDRYTNVPYEQLKGIREGFNLGKFNEFYFVTNKEFSTNFINEVNKTNLELVRDHINTSGTRPPTNIGNADKYDDAVKQFVKDNHIDQIEMCEHVKYPGT